MAITVTGTPTTTDNAGGTSSSTIVVNVPTGAAVGEVLVCHIASGSNNGAVTTPSGWTALQTGPDTFGPTVYGTLAYRVVTGTEAASYTWTTASSSNKYAATMFRVAGANTTTPFRTSAFASANAKSASSSIVTGPALTGVQSTDEVFFFWAVGDNSSAAQPATYTMPGGIWTTTHNRGVSSKGTAGAHATGNQTAPTVSGGTTNDSWVVIGAAMQAGTTTGSGSFAGSGSGTLAVTGTPKPAQSAAFTGSGTFATTGTPNPSQAAAFSGTGTLTAQPGTVWHAAGSGTLAVTGPLWSDDFSTLDTASWTPADPALNTVTGGQLVQTCASSYGGELDSLNRVIGLVGAQVTVELVQTANLGNGSTESYLGLQDPADHSHALFFDVRGDTGALRLVCSAWDATGHHDLVNPLYSPTDHRWLRLRESAGTVYWDVSPDAITWTTLTSWVSTIALTSLYAALGTGHYATEPTPGTAIWDNFSVVSVGAGTPAPIQSAGLAGSGGLSADAPVQVGFTGSGILTASGSPAIVGPGLHTNELASDGRLTVATQAYHYCFSGPVVYDYRPLEKAYPQLLHIFIPYGTSVWQDAGGAWHNKFWPGPDELAGAQRVYPGGRCNELDDAGLAAIQASPYADLIHMEKTE